ncbi:Type II secretion system protein E [Lacunisphaera limnophila]|uniref:Type II secretion system protein E n=1 Tax=Lacunisphaera limnophila TaxID=1838286 RepID=A0A1D8ARZ9_9BACT|nr:GspE/PulE family protein [Lacunisphaera limnophila]AOS43650.1 Type II secretion system protein E [Lacunisphaera limnophila]
MAPKIDAAFIAAIRRLRTFSHGCDLDALAATLEDPLELLEHLVTAGHLLKEEAGRHWSGLTGLAYVDPITLAITEDAIALLPAEIAGKTQALPLYRVGGTLTVAMARPNPKHLASLSKIVQLPVSPVFAFPADIRDLLKLHYTNEEALDAARQSAEQFDQFTAGIDLSAGGKEIAHIAETEQVVQFVNAMVYFAIRREASDIHIEPREKESHVRYRIDGILREVLVFSRKLHASVVTRLKILCQLDIAETRFPQDGRFSLPMGSTNIDFRFSSIPSQYGEKAVARILGSTSRKALLSLDKMKISRPILTPLRRIMRNPSGIIFVTGPTGSGKTTTLYAALAELNDSGVNISTIEDPIEMKLEGITQTQVQHKIDMSFAKMLRALLRQDPDIMLVGEIRDLETAKIATEAALTGHLVLATMHTNSAPEAITRLAEIGVDPYMIAPSVVAVLGQRLAARICEHCKEPYRPADEVLRRYFNDKDFPEITFYRGRGCHVCNKTGYKGRVAFHELFLVNRTIRSKINARAGLAELTEQAARLGYRPLRYDGLKKVLQGMTTIDEIEAQTPIEFEG